MSEIYMLMTVTKRSIGRQLLAYYDEIGLSSFTLYAGQRYRNERDARLFGLEVTEKMVTRVVVSDHTWKQVKTGLENKFQIDVPGTGIAFLVPLSSVGGKKVLQFLAAGQVVEKIEESVMKNTNYELIIVIANHGHSEEVMDAAKSRGAPAEEL